MSNFYSQFSEDRWIRGNLNPPPGVFVEVGSFDGIQGSNSLHFEKEGWRGVCIEPVPENAAKCRANRNAVTWCCAAGASGLKPFFLSDDLGAGGLARVGRPFPVVVCSLEEIVLASGFREIDLLSVDTEGTELEVLKTMGRFTPKILIVEFWTQPNPPLPEPIIAWASENNYREVHRTTANLIFTKVG